MPHKSLLPKIITVLREGYTLAMLRADFIAGLTVAIVALPLSMALGIASGATPEQGLITAMIGGLVISLFSGSRFQIGGPAGAFVVIIYNIIANHGYDGLVIATMMAGVILLVAAFLRLGQGIRFIPMPVIIGFTLGIAVIIFSSQIRDLFGLQIEKVPGDFIAKWAVLWEARHSFTLQSAFISLAGISLIVALRRFAPKIPAFLVVVILASMAAYAMHMPVPTIGTQFGGIPDTLPMPGWPEFTLAKMQEMLPSALIIAFLAGIESLLCAMVADGMTGRRHRSNAELMAQGFANFFSGLFGGMPATGTIARTATNVKAGAVSPVSGIIHALAIALFILLASDLASFIPLASLAAILVIVCWNMCEFARVREIIKNSRQDTAILFTTFILTVVADLTVGIAAGVVLSLILHRLKPIQP